MKTSKVLPYILVVGLLLTLIGSAGLGFAQGPQPSGDVSITAAVDTKFSYQGVLKEYGSPVTGDRDMTFRLYADDTCTTQVGGDIVKNGVQVSDGLFSVELEVAQSNFDGQALWLEMEVDGTKIGCQEILPVPYALGLRPGAYIEGDSSGMFALPVFSVKNLGDGTAITAASNGTALSATSDASSAVYAESGSTTDDDAAVYALANGGSGYVSGVYGVSNSLNGTGVLGEGYSSTGNNFGVRGLTRSSQGTGVYGWAGSYSGTDGYPYGVRGYSQSGHGVYGSTNGDWNWISGVYGLATKDHANGVTGWNSAAGVGVYAWSEEGTAIVAKGGGSVLMSVYERATDNLRFRVDSDGEVYADGSFHSGGADLAEMLPAAKGPEPGDVLVAGPDGRLLRSTTPYDPKVVGVYSSQPGFVGGSGDDLDNSGDIPLAIVGVVPVKASAENGPIAPGDLLVASSTPGHAMKAAPNPPIGTVIGKALEPLEKGTGVIKMLVMLQ